MDKTTLKSVVTNNVKVIPSVDSVGNITLGVDINTDKIISAINTHIDRKLQGKNKRLLKISKELEELTKYLEE